MTRYFAYSHDELVREIERLQQDLASARDLARTLANGGTLGGHWRDAYPWLNELPDDEEIEIDQRTADKVTRHFTGGD